jgi:hypothetical protein
MLKLVMNIACWNGGDEYSMLKLLQEKKACSMNEIACWKMVLQNIACWNWCRKKIACWIEKLHVEKKSSMLKNVEKNSMLSYRSFCWWGKLKFQHGPPRLVRLAQLWVRVWNFSQRAHACAVSVKWSMTIAHVGGGEQGIAWTLNSHIWLDSRRVTTRWVS